MAKRKRNYYKILFYLLLGEVTAILNWLEKQEFWSSDESVYQIGGKSNGKKENKRKKQ